MTHAAGWWWWWWCVVCVLQFPPGPGIRHAPRVLGFRRVARRGALVYLERGLERLALAQRPYQPSYQRSTAHAIAFAASCFLLFLLSPWLSLSVLSLINPMTLPVPGPCPWGSCPVPIAPFSVPGGGGGCAVVAVSTESKDMTPGRCRRVATDPAAVRALVCLMPWSAAWANLAWRSFSILALHSRGECLP